MLIPLILLILCFGAVSAQAQNDAPPVDDDFVYALVVMTINHNMMAGKNEVRDLSALRAYVRDYYDDRIRTVESEGDSAQDLQRDQTMVLTQLDNKISEKSGLGALKFFVDLFSESVNDQSSAQQIKTQRAQVVSGSDDPPQNYFEAMESMVMTDIEIQVNLLLDIDIISKQPSLAPAIADSSGWSYDVSAISNLTNPISPSTAGDAFSGGGDDSSGVGDSSAPISGGDSSSNTTDDGTKLKPLRFSNNGFEPVTVVVESYEPAPGYSSNKPNASTVVTPESNPSGYLELPLGTYTFCYYWQLDKDYNNDDYFDYHHRTTASVTLNVNSSDDPQSAIAVTLSPDSEVSNPNGKCGQVPAQNQNPSDLAPEEQANQGTHTYSVYYDAPGAYWLDGQSATIVLNVDFYNGGAHVGLVGDEHQTYTLVPAGPNVYTWTDPDNGKVQVYTFTMDGLEIQSEVGLDGEYYDCTTICTLQD